MFLSRPSQIGPYALNLPSCGFKRLLLLGAPGFGYLKRLLIALQIFLSFHAVLRQSFKLKARPRQSSLGALKFFAQFPALMIQRQNILFLRLLFRSQMFQMFRQLGDVALYSATAVCAAS